MDKRKVRNSEIPKAEGKVAKKQSKAVSTLSSQFDTMKRNLGFLSNEITPTQLRNLARNNPIVAVAIKKTKNKVLNQSLRVKVKSDVKGKIEDYTEEVKMLNHLLEGQNQVGDSFRKTMSKVLEDLLILDYGVIEKQKNYIGETVNLYHVDAATIEENRTETGIFKGTAYIQYVDAMSEGVGFAYDELLTFQVNPSPEIERGFGWHAGNSPVRIVIGTVISGIQALLYNTRYFTEGTIPPAIANLKGVSSEEVVAFSRAFEEQMKSNPNKIAFTNADTLDMRMFRPTNQEMQFYELNLWLARIVISAFDSSPQEFGLTMDVNRATAETQKEISQTGGIAPYTKTIINELNTDLIAEMGKINPKFNDLEFYVDVNEATDPKVQAEIDDIYIANKVLKPQDVQKRMGLEISEEEEMEEIEESTEVEMEDEGETEISKSYKKNTWTINY